MTIEELDAFDIVYQDRNRMNIDYSDYNEANSKNLIGKLCVWGTTTESCLSNSYVFPYSTVGGYLYIFKIKTKTIHQALPWSLHPLKKKEITK